MDINQLSLIFGWSAILSAAATIATFVTGILFFSVGKPFGKINDIASIFQVLLMIPLTIMFMRLLPPSPSNKIAIAVGIIGIAGMLISAWGQSLLVFGRIDFDTSRKFFPAGLAIGVWLTTINALVMPYGVLSKALCWAGIGAGVGYLLTVVGFLRGGQSHWLFIAGALGLAVCYPTWAIGLGRLLLYGLLRMG
jgi:hypothetical protein